MSNPQISVLMPVYNAGAYLTSAVDSIIAQTVSDFELLILDDGSTDHSLNILHDCAKKDARIRITSRANKGFVTTINELLDQARGQWIARMDQDDIALPHRFKRQLQWIEQTSADICGSWIQFIGKDQGRILRYPVGDDAIRAGLLFGTSFAHPTVMMKTERVKALRYDPAWEKAEDYDLWCRAVQAGWKMTNVPEVLLHYRQHPNQISSVSAEKQKDLSFKIRQHYWEWFFDSRNLSHTGITDILKLRDPAAPKVDMNAVDAAFEALLTQYNNEARTLIFDHATKLYCRAAGQGEQILKRWSRLNDRFGSGAALKTKAILWLLQSFRLGPNNPLFQNLKKLYFSLRGE